MNRDDLVDVLPHYAVMLIAVFVGLGVLEAVLGPVSFWIEIAVITFIVFSYQPIVVQLGLAPDAWTRR